MCLVWSFLLLLLLFFLRLIQYISPRDVLSRDDSPCADMYVVGEKPGATLSVLRCFFFLFSTASRKVYNSLLKTSKTSNLSTPFWCLMSEDFSVTITLIKFLQHKALGDLDCLWSWSLKLLLQRPQIQRTNICFHPSSWGLVQDSETTCKLSSWGLSYKVYHYKATVIKTVFFWHKNIYNSMEHARNPRDQYMHLWAPYLWWRRQEIYNREKTASSINGPGETGYLCVKE